MLDTLAERGLNAIVREQSRASWPHAYLPHVCGLFIAPDYSPTPAFRFSCSISILMACFASSISPLMCCIACARKTLGSPALSSNAASILLKAIIGKRLSSAALDSGKEIEVVVELRPIRALRFEYEADQAFEMSQHMLNVDIADAMNCSPAKVTGLIHRAEENRGIAQSDGRERRKQLLRKQRTPPIRERIADDVLRLLQKGMLIIEIADELSVDRNYVTDAIKYLRDGRGIDIPDGRTRRKSLSKKTRFYQRKKRPPASSGDEPTVE
jgi:hypothetical protein